MKLFHGPLILVDFQNGLVKEKENIILINQFWKNVTKSKDCIEAGALVIRLYFTVHSFYYFDLSEIFYSYKHKHFLFYSMCLLRD